MVVTWHHLHFRVMEELLCVRHARLDITLPNERKGPGQHTAHVKANTCGESEERRQETS